MKSILVPTDFSVNALKASEVAADLALKTNSKILLLHNVNTLVKWDSLSEDDRQKYPETYEKNIEAEINLKKLAAGAVFRKVSVDKLITYGVPYDEIVTWACKHKSDMIVMGSHGNESSEKYFIGSNMQKVLRVSHCPVLMIKKNAEIGYWSKVVFAANFDEDLGKPFNRIQKLAKELGSKIHLLYINTPAKFKDTKTAHKQMSAFASQYPDQDFEMAIYNHHDLASGILDYSEEIRADWIAMATHNRKMFPRYLLGVTETVAFKTDIPVLSVNLSIKD